LKTSRKKSRNSRPRSRKNKINTTSSRKRLALRTKSRSNADPKTLGSRVKLIARKMNYVAPLKTSLSSS
jgi:hypothetical protein